jgi:hypothetical protein
MHFAKTAFKPRRGHDWTQERIDQLSTQDIEQLRVNAEKLGEDAVLSLCDAALKTRPNKARKNGSGAAKRTHPRNLISRTKAFQARGVFLAHMGGSWSGLRKSDGVVVMSLWASAVVSGDGGCSHLLWAPNLEGSRPWSDMAAGKERLEHCKLALKDGGGEGLLVYGELLEGHLAEHKTRSVYGVDPETVVNFQVEQRGEEYWAVWGRKGVERPL